MLCFTLSLALRGLLPQRSDAGRSLQTTDCENYPDSYRDSFKYCICLSYASQSFAFNPACSDTIGNEVKETSRSYTAFLQTTASRGSIETYLFIFHKHINLRTFLLIGKTESMTIKKKAFSFLYTINKTFSLYGIKS